MRIELHLENESPSVNKARVERIATKQADIQNGIAYPFTAGMWGENWASADFRIPWDDVVPNETVTSEAVLVMPVLVQRTWPIVLAMS